MVILVISDPLAFPGVPGENTRMGSTGAIDTAVSALSAGGTASSIAVSILSQTESAQAQQIATLFSSIGLGGNISALA
jgi:hypothetical protein